MDDAEAMLVSVCNATGALHHLTFLDEAKQQVRAAGGAVAASAGCKRQRNSAWQKAGRAIDQVVPLAVEAKRRLPVRPRDIAIMTLMVIINDQWEMMNDDC